MRTRSLAILFCSICLSLTLCVRSAAQEGGDRDRPGGSGNPGGPGGLNNPTGPPNQGAPGNPRRPHHADTTKDRIVPQPKNALQFGPVGRWWDNRSVVQAVGLRREQTKRMDAIFDANKPAILSSYKTFLKAQDNLTALNKNPQADKTEVFAAIDAVNQARSALQKSAAAMLLQIRGEMDANQISKLEKVQ